MNPSTSFISHLHVGSGIRNVMDEEELGESTSDATDDETVSIETKSEQ